MAVLNVREFGRIFSISRTRIDDTDVVQAAYQLALDDFFRAKKETFPYWKGLPEIKVGPGSDPIREISIGWYAVVDNTDVVDPREEDELWQS